MSNRSVRGHSGPAWKPTQPRKLPIGALAVGALVLVVLIGVVVAVIGGGDAEDDTAQDLTYGEVEVSGAPLPSYEGAPDPAEGAEAPVLVGQALDGTEVSVGGDGEPTVVVFLAHWCPHCQAEVPVIVGVAEDGGFEGVRLVAVLTNTNPDAPNYPPGEWLAREGWPGDVLVDDAASTAGAAYGLGAFPYLVAVDADGVVASRASGELPAEQLEALAASALGAAG